MADAHPSFLAHHFQDIDQQKECQTLGMWLFLAQEIMFFGALFFIYTLYRVLHPADWEAASRSLNVWAGFLNTLILLTSSYTVARAVHAAQEDKQRDVIKFLIWTIICAIGFCVVKYFEYGEKFAHHRFPGPDFQFHEPSLEGKIPFNVNNVQLFLGLYFTMTGLHALHVVIGILIFVPMVFCAHRGWYRNGNYMPVEIAGLYWHFVDIVWIFLYPCLYLINRAPLH